MKANLYVGTAFTAVAMAAAYAFVPPGATETAINASTEVFREILIELKEAATSGAALAVANVPAAISRA